MVSAGVLRRVAPSFGIYLAAALGGLALESGFSILAFDTAKSGMALKRTTIVWKMCED